MVILHLILTGFAARPGAEPIPMVQSIACDCWRRSGIERGNRRGIALHDGGEAIKPRAQTSKTPSCSLWRHACLMSGSDWTACKAFLLHLLKDAEPSAIGLGVTLAGEAGLC